MFELEIIVLISIRHQFNDSFLAEQYLLFKNKVFLKKYFLCTNTFCTDCIYYGFPILELNQSHISFLRPR